MSNEDTGPKINPGDIILWPMLKLDYDTNPEKIAALLPPGMMTDLDGAPRIADGDLDGEATVDLGAFELHPGDTNGDGEVNTPDLVNIILCWGSSGVNCAGSGVYTDLIPDGNVNVHDLLEVILHWTQ